MKSLFVSILQCSLVTVFSQTWTPVSQLSRLGLQKTLKYGIDRAGHVMAPAAQGKGFYIFGGYLKNEIDFSNYEENFWLFNTSTLLWNPIFKGEGLAPESRADHVLITHQSGAYAILHGGENDLYTFSDLWVLDLNVGEWSFVFEKDGPPPLVWEYECVLNDTDVIFGIFKWNGTLTEDEIDSAQYYAEVQNYWEIYPSVELPDGQEIFLVNTTSDPNDPRYEYYIFKNEEVTSEVTLNCSDIDWASTPWPDLKNHAGAYDPYTDRFIIHGGIDTNGTIRGETYAFTITQFNGTWLANMTQIVSANYSTYSHAMSVVTFDDAPSQVVIFGGTILFEDNLGVFETDVKEMRILDLADESQGWLGPYKPPKITPLFPATSELTMVFNSVSDQLWIMGGESTKNKHYFVDVNTRNATFWEWRFGADLLYGVSEHAVCIVQDNNRKFLVKFGGVTDVAQPVGSMERSLFFNGNSSDTRRLGTPMILPPAPPTPPRTISEFTTTIMSSSRRTTTTSTTSKEINKIEELTGLTATGQLVAFAVIGVVVFLFFMAGIVLCLKKRSSAKKRPAKTNFYSL